MQENSEPDGDEQPVYLLHDDTLDTRSLQSLLERHRIELIAWQDYNRIESGSRLLLYVDETRLRELLPLVLERQCAIGVLCHPGARFAIEALGVTGNLRQNLNHYLNVDPIEADVLVCNNEPVLSSVIIGDGFTRNALTPGSHPSRLRRFWRALKIVRQLRLRGFRAATGKGQKVQIAALGLLVTQNARCGPLGRSFSDVISTSDARFTLIAVSPRSVLSYLWLLLRILLATKLNASRLPASIGLMRNQVIQLESDGEIEYLVDGELRKAKQIEFKVRDEGIRLLPGKGLVYDSSYRQKVDKDNNKIDHLPIDDSAQPLLGVPLPLFNRAGEGEHRDLFVALRSSAAFTSSFLVLMLLSTLLALTGLYANSAPVIIGAMILAPLMAPIVSLAMGLARTEAQLIRMSLRTLLLGVGAGLLCGIGFAWLMPTQSPTAEMVSRISPTLLDLAVAVLSGVAGAYAHAKEEIAKSLAGVAIAVALVPPLSVAGIGIGWAEWEMARGAALLFITNIIGISLAATLTFLMLGFAPFKLAQKGLLISLVLMSMIAIPLYFTFEDMVERSQIRAQIPRGQFELAGLQVNLRDVRVFVGSTPLVRVGMSSSQRLDEEHVEALKELISERIGRPIYLEAQFYLRR